ncbi:hypothetical protein BJ912DRAFT_903793 [Pholiota molesta]|nr:hypothetical protein BJ912DRAFT_903793 [Pholiota molesta]
MVDNSTTMTMLSSRSRDSTRSPITEIPYDVIREIFFHCLPRRPLDIREAQPNTTIAPMLLCQICSSWRTIALASPSLWSHLAYYIMGQSIDRKLGSWAVRQKSLDFMIWWKRNQGSMAPFLHLDIDLDAQKLGQTQDIPLAEDGIAFLLEYMISAQYLQVSPRLSKQIHDKLAVRNQVIFSDLHTLVVYRDDQYFHHTQVLIGLLSTTTSPPLRRLAMTGYILPVDAVIPDHWSKLTHLSMNEVAISMTSWFSLIRAVPELQWAHISLKFHDINVKIEDYTKSTTKYTLPQLSTLFLTYCGEQGSNYKALPLTFIFTSLYLPALQTLSLTSLVDSWEDHHTISELYTALHSTPAVTTLHLGGYTTLSSRKISRPAYLSDTVDIEPIWSHVPHLTHLELDLPWVAWVSVHSEAQLEAGKVLDAFVRNICWPDCRWLALNIPTCSIQRVTLYTRMGLSAIHNAIKEMTMSSILSRIGGASESNIVFNIVSGTGDAGPSEWM